MNEKQFITGLMAGLIAIPITLFLVIELNLENSFWGFLIILSSGLPLVLLGLPRIKKLKKKFNENDKDYILIKEDLTK